MMSMQQARTWRAFLVFFAASLLLGPARPGAAAAPAASALRPDPGELAILDKDGQTVGFCPLKHTDVQADVSGYVAHVTVTQEFGNSSRTPIEAVYTFPLPADAAVDDMTMTIGARLVQGEIKRRDEARAIYDAAKNAGQATALLDQERPNIFTQSVANILPGDTVKITIKYVDILKYQAGRYEWAFPLVVGPRYTPSGGYTIPGKRGDPSATPPVPTPLVPTPMAEAPGFDVSPSAPPAIVTDADKITPPITPPGTRAGHDIAIHVHLNAGLPLTGLTSVLHPISIKRLGADAADITLANAGEIPNKDFILRWTAAGSEMQSGMLTYAPGDGQVASISATPGLHTGGYFTLILQPPLAPPRSAISPKEMVFVIDQTGSQMGWPIEKAKQTMRTCIQRLNPGDTFQLIGFNTDVYPCFPAPVPATPENIKTALDYLAPLAGAGGTDILKAADYALKMPDDPARLRIVCFMTDGYVGNDMQILDYVKTHRGRARMFPFGIGNGVNRFLIDGMATEGRGAAEYVTLDEDGQEAADRFAKRIADPILLNPQVDWHGLPVEEVYPQHIPDVFSQGPIIIKGRYTNASSGNVTVSGYLHGRPWSQTIHVDFPASQGDGSAIATLWARDRIDDLQSQDWIGAQTGKPDPTIQDKIVQTALDYNLMSQWTSFVAVEQRVVNIGGRQRTVDVPVDMPEGVSYDGIFGSPALGYLPVSNTSGASLRSLAVGGAFGGGGGFGGGRGGGGAPASASSNPLTLLPPNGQATHVYALEGDISQYSLAAPADKDILDDTPAGQTRLQALTPADKRALLEQVKLAPALLPLAQGKPATGPNAPAVTEGRVAVLLRLNALPPDGLAKLKALGFTLSATLTPGKVLLGTIAPADLDALLDLGWVRRVEPPQFR